MTPLAKELLSRVARKSPAPCGVAAAQCFPNAPKISAALAEYHDAFSDIITRESASDLLCFARYLASAHGIAEVQKPAGPALGVVGIAGRQSFAVYDGRTWWVTSPRGIRTCPPGYVLAVFEVDQ